MKTIMQILPSLKQGGVETGTPTLLCLTGARWWLS